MLYSRNVLSRLESMLKMERGRNTIDLVLLSGTNKHHGFGSEPYQVAQNEY